MLTRTAMRTYVARHVEQSMRGLVVLCAVREMRRRGQARTDGFWDGESRGAQYPPLRLLGGIQTCHGRGISSALTEVSTVESEGLLTRH